MPGPPPPPPPPMMGGPPPPPSLGGLSAAAPDRNALLKSIADPSKPKLKKVDPSQIKDRSKPTVGGGVVGSSSDPVSTKKTSGVASSGPNPMAGMSLQDQLAKRLQERNRTNNSPAPSVQSNNLIATHQQTKHNTNTNNSSNHYASNSVINKPLPTVPSSNVNSRQSNKENGPSNSVNNLQNHKKVLENFFSSSSNSSSVSTPSSVSSANGQAVNSKSNDTNKSKANGEMKKMAPPVPPPRQDLSRDDTMLNKYHGQNQIPAFPKPVRAPSPSSTGATPQFPTTNKPPPPPPAPMSQQQQHPPLPPTPAQAPPLPPYNRNMTKPLNVAPPPPPPPVAPPPIPDKYSHHPPPPPPPNQPPPPPPPSRPAPPRPPPQPPTKSIDDLERRFQFLPLPGSADLPRVFSPPNDREYPSAKYEVKMRSNGNH